MPGQQQNNFYLCPCGADKDWRSGGTLKHSPRYQFHLGLANNQISDISPLVGNSGIGKGDGVDLTGNPINDEAYNVHIPALIERGVIVLFDQKPEEWE